MATLEELEKRLIALEKAVLELQELQSRAQRLRVQAAQEEIIPESECFIVVSAPPAEMLDKKRM